MSRRSVVALSGGVGGARLVSGLAAALAPDALTVVVNTGDDFDHWGVRVCPDLDTVMYTLSGLADEARGWGLAGDTTGAFEMVRRYGGPAWFQLGDRDLATHLVRTQALARGERLTDVTRGLFRALGVAHPVLPMSDLACPTVIETRTPAPAGETDRASGETAASPGATRSLPFQDWFVRERCAPAIARIRLGGAGAAPSPEALAAIAGADLVVIGPSNPYVSIDPILCLAGVRDALAGRAVVAVSPIVSGRAVKGPLAEMIPQIAGTPASAAAVAAHYRGLLSGFVVAPGDEPAVAHEHRAPDLGRPVAVHATDIVMRDRAARARLAREVLAFAATLG